MQYFGNDYIMQKKIVSLSLFVLLLGLVGYFIYTTLDIKSDQLAQETIPLSVLKEEAKVVNESGIVNVQRSDSTIPVPSEEPLQLNDVVTLSPDTIAIFYWPDGSLSRATGPAEISIAAMMFDDATGVSNTEVDIKSGEVWTKVMGMITEGSTMTVRTGDTVAGIRGTALFHRVNDDATTIGVLEHGIEVVHGEENSFVFQGQSVISTPNVPLDREVVSLADYEIANGAWQRLVDTQVAQLRTKRIALLPVPKNTLEDLLQDTDTLLSRTERTVNENNRIHSNIQDIVVGWGIALGNSDKKSVEAHTAALERIIGQTRQAFANDSTHATQLLRELSLYGSIMIVDKPLSSEERTLRKVLQYEKAELYNSLGQFEMVERLLIKELLYIQALSFSDLDAVDTVLQNLGTSQVLLRPLSQDSTSSNAIMVNNLLDTFEQQKTITTEALQRIRARLFPEKNTTNANTNIPTEEPTKSTQAPSSVVATPAPEENTTTPKKVTPAVAPTTPTPTPKVEKKEPVIEKPVVVEPAPTTVIKAPNRAVEPTPPPVAPAPTATRGTLTSSR